MSIEQIAELFEGSMLIYYAGLGGLLMLVITVTEALFDLYTRKGRNWRDSGANVSIGLFKDIVLATLFGAVGVVGLYLVSLLQLWTIPMTAASWLAGLILADLTYYWMHRLEHENRFLWGLHSVHHSSQDFNLTVAFRLSVFEDLVEWVFLFPMVLIGFNVFQAFACLIVVAVYQNWIHTEKIGRLGVFDRWFNTPSVHRVHHGSNPQYLDKNYGGILMVWDHLFGTYQAEEEKVVYGLVENIDSCNPITINIIEYQKIWQDMQRCRRLRDKLQILFGGTNWRPDYFGTEKTEQPYTRMQND